MLYFQNGFSKRSAGTVQTRLGPAPRALTRSNTDHVVQGLFIVYFSVRPTDLPGNERPGTSVNNIIATSMCNNSNFFAYLKIKIFYFRPFSSVVFTEVFFLIDTEGLVLN